MSNRQKVWFGAGRIRGDWDHRVDEFGTPVMRLRMIAVLLIALTTSTGTSIAGTHKLTGRFVLEGKRPERQPLTSIRNERLLQKSRSAISTPHSLPLKTRDGKPVYDESLRVGRFLGIQNIIVWIRSKNVPRYISPVNTKSVGRVKPVVPLVEWKDHAFYPRVLVLPAGSSIALKNSSDQVANFHWTPIRNSAFNILGPSNQKEPVVVDLIKGETVPARLRNDLAPWSTGWIFPCENSYVSSTDEEGVFHIENIPDGNWEFSVWHERCGYIRTGAWPKGRFQLVFQEPKPGEIDPTRDLGVIRLGPEIFAEDSAATISEEEFLRLHAQLQPDPTEPWRTIPWKISLLDAQQVAAEEKKPLFIWAMDGHPLGCT